MINKKLGFLLAFLFINNFQSQDIENYSVDFNTPQSNPAQKDVSIEKLYEKIYKCNFSWAAVRQLFALPFFRQGNVTQPMRQFVACGKYVALLGAVLLLLIELYLITIGVRNSEPRDMFWLSFGIDMVIAIIVLLIWAYFQPGSRGWNNPLAKALVNEIIKERSPGKEMSSGKKITSTVPQIQAFLDAIAAKIDSGKKISGYDKVSIGETLKKLLDENRKLAQALSVA